MNIKIFLLSLIITFGIYSVDTYASPTPTVWSDSYDAGDGICRCDSSYDHGIDTTVVDTPCGQKTVPEICAAIAEKYGTGPTSPRTYYNTVQCGHPPLNNVADETVCPGIPNSAQDYSGPRCFETGSLWPLAGICEVEGALDCQSSLWQSTTQGVRLIAECLPEARQAPGHMQLLKTGMLMVAFFGLFAIFYINNCHSTRGL